MRRSGTIPCGSGQAAQAPPADRGDQPLFFIEPQRRGRNAGSLHHLSDVRVFHLLPNIPARQPDAPGQFTFADRRRVYRILEESGSTGIDIRPIDVACTLPEKELVRYLSRLGPLGLILHEVDDRTRTQVIETVRAAFDPYLRGAEVRFTAACWTVGARAPVTSAAPKEAASA